MLRLPPDCGDDTPGDRGESTMSWIVIAVVLLVAFGPIFWLVPSVKDRRLTKLRARGRAEGLVIELKRIPKPDPEPHERVSAGGKVRTPVIECASYGHPLARKLNYLPQWRLVRTPNSEQPDPFADWTFDQRPSGTHGRRYLDEVLELTTPLLNQLPGDVIAFEIDVRFLRVYWLEKSGSDEASVSEIARLLRGFETEIMALETQIEAQLDNDDS
jgi:hypothetical protein